MPFPLDEKFVVAVEDQIGTQLPHAYRDMMITENGGRVQLGRENWWLHPIFDTSDKKRLKRTCNHILHETKTRRVYGGFPDDGIEIGANSSGDAIIFLARNNIVSDVVYEFCHETQSVKKTRWTANDLLDKRASS